MKPVRLLNSNGGYTYVAAIVTVVILGIMSAQAAQVWKTTMQREKETELLFRGMQIRDAMQLYYYGKVVRSGKAPTPLPNRSLSRLDELLQDPSSAGKKRYLRKLYKDPMTGEDFALVKHPTTQQVVGVASTSELAPIKQGNFPFELERGDFEGKKKYSEWLFRYDRVPTQTVIGSGNGTPPPSPPPAKQE